MEANISNTVRYSDESGQFVEKYHSYVPTFRNALEWPLPKEDLDSGLEELVKFTLRALSPPSPVHSDSDRF